MAHRDLRSLVVVVGLMVVGDSGLTPDPNKTPGNRRPGVTAADVCVKGYATKYRNVPASVKASAYQEYGITSHPKGEYEVDHLISLELGGSNEISNLWPESYQTQPLNAHVKDHLENALHAAICRPQNPVSMATAQQAIATDWIGAYKTYVGPLPAATGAVAAVPEPDGDAQDVQHATVGVVIGRVVNSIDTQGSLARVQFGDGSTMIIETGGAVQGPSGTGKVTSAEQTDAGVQLHLEDNTVVSIPTAHRTSSVIIRDRHQRLEFID